MNIAMQHVLAYIAENYKQQKAENPITQVQDQSPTFEPPMGDGLLFKCSSSKEMLAAIVIQKSQSLNY